MARDNKSKGVTINCAEPGIEAGGHISGHMISHGRRWVCFSDGSKLPLSIITQTLWSLALEFFPKQRAEMQANAKTLHTSPLLQKTPIENLHEWSYIFLLAGHLVRENGKAHRNLFSLIVDALRWLFAKLYLIQRPPINAYESRFEWVTDRLQREICERHSSQEKMSEERAKIGLVEPSRKKLQGGRDNSPLETAPPFEEKRKVVGYFSKIGNPPPEFWSLEKRLYPTGNPPRKTLQISAIF
jgi:hypothetical protein